MIENVFDKLELDFFHFAQQAKEFNFDVSRVGSCALVALL